MPYKKNMTDEDWQILAREMEARLFANIPENDDEIEHPHVFSERFNKKMEEVFAIFDEKEKKEEKPYISQTHI